MHQLIDERGLQNDVKCIATIYDSIYYIVKKDSSTISWVNDNLIRCMSQDFIKDQIVPNTAEAEIGPSWAVLHELSNNASLDEIEEVLEKF